MGEYVSSHVSSLGLGGTSEQGAWPGAIPQLLDDAYLTQTAADLINSKNYGFTVRGDNAQLAADADRNKTPADSPYKDPLKSYTWMIYDQDSGVWNKWEELADGSKIETGAYVRVAASDIRFPNDIEHPEDYQRVTYAPASMDRPMFVSHYDENHGYTAQIQKVLTGHEVFTVGGVGTPESVGTVDFSTPDRPNAKLSWELKDHVLILSGDVTVLPHFAVRGNTPFCSNPYIETVIWNNTDLENRRQDELFDYDFFNGCPNLKTFFITYGHYQGYSVNRSMESINYKTAEGKLVMIVADAFGGWAEEPHIIEIRDISDYLRGSHEPGELGGGIYRYDSVNGNMGLFNADGALPGKIPEELETAWLSQAAADLINGKNYGFTVTADEGPSDQTVETMPIYYDPEKTDGGTASNPNCSDWARPDVIAAWSLFGDRIPYLQSRGPKTNIIEKNLRLPITRAEFATLAAAAYDYILGDTAVNDGYDDYGFNEWNSVHGRNVQELLEPLNSELSWHMTDLWYRAAQGSAVPHYYQDGIHAAICMGLMNGLSETVFGPDNYLTREQAATVLMRMADLYSGFPYRNAPNQSAAFPAEGENPYTDLISGWALEGVLRAKEAGIMLGTGDATFSAQSNFTREQAIVTLYRMVNWCKPWYRALTEEDLKNKDIHLAVNPNSNNTVWKDVGEECW